MTQPHYFKTDPRVKQQNFGRMEEQKNGEMEEFFGFSDHP